MRGGGRLPGLVGLALLLVGGWGTPPVVRASEPELVQCLLPSAVRRLGPIAYLPPRRVVAVTAAQCGRMAGEEIDPARAMAINEAQLPLRPTDQEGTGP